MAADTRDLIAGALIAMTGGLIAAQAGLSYDLGTLRRMGPGMFPFGLGLLMVGLGVVIAGTAFFRLGDPVRMQARAPLAVLAAVAAFAVLIQTFGLLPAIVGVVIVSAFAEKKLRPVSILFLSLTLMALAVAIFRIGLNLPITLIDWPF